MLHPSTHCVVLLHIILQQRWPQMMHEIDEQSLDMRSIMILIGHEHHVGVAQSVQRFRGGVGFAEFETEEWMWHARHACILLVH